jgi:alkylation response protein AidB-like acyl-CoA dehydrogenase
MNFQLTKTQLMTRRAMREFVRKEVVPLAPELDENAEFPLANYKQALELEVLDITLPEALGGIGDDFLNFIIALEEFGCGNAALAYSISVTEAIIHLLCRYGSKNQQEKYIHPLRTGEAFGAPAMGVPGADHWRMSPMHLWRIWPSLSRALAMRACPLSFWRNRCRDSRYTNPKS